MLFSNSTYDLKKIHDDSFLAYTHLGLGDHIICNGLINYFSKDFKLIFLPVKSRDLNNLEYLYKKNKKVKIFKIEHDTEVQDIKSLAKKESIKILKVGFKKRKPPFNLSFYEQFNLSYDISFDFFHVPENKKNEEELFEHLKKHYDIKSNYQLVHNQSSYGKVSLKTNPELPIIFVDKETDIFKNIFLYRKVIENSSEIHCLDSSFLHLVERMPTNGDLYFHKIKKDKQESAKVHLIKNWKEINYI